MKKLLAIILSALILSTSVACSSDKENDAPVNEAPDAAIEDVVDDETDPEPETEEVPEVEEGVLSRGIIDGNTYTSSFTGIEITIPDTWSFANDEEIAALTGAGMEVLDINEFAKYLAENATIYDMMASEATTGSNVSICYENTNITAPGRNITVEDYAAAITQTITAQDQIPYTVGDTGVVTLCGEEYYKVEMTADVSGITLSQAYYLRAIDNYMISVIATAANGVTLADIEGLFNA